MSIETDCEYLTFVYFTLHPPWYITNWQNFSLGMGRHLKLFLRDNMSPGRPLCVHVYFKVCFCVCVRGKALLTLHMMQSDTCLLPCHKALPLTPGALWIIFNHFMCHVLSWQPAPLPFFPSHDWDEERESHMNKTFKLNRDFHPSISVLALHSISPSASEWLHYRAVVPICNPIHGGPGVITMIPF